MYRKKLSHGYRSQLKIWGSCLGLVGTLVACGSSKSEETASAPSDDCERLALCCQQLDTEPAKQNCLSALTKAAGHDDECAPAVESFEQAGLCQNQVKDGGSPLSDSGSSPHDHDAASLDSASEPDDASGPLDVEASGPLDVEASMPDMDVSASDADASDPPQPCQPSCATDEICEDGGCKKLPSTCPCPVAFYCDLDTNTCKPGCLKDEHCPQGSFCDLAARTCKDGCRDPSECPTDWTCSNHVCENHCASCDDGSVCTEDSCIDRECAHQPVAAVTPCPSDDNTCTEDICGNGVCQHLPVDDDTPCPDDGEVCTTDTCHSGVCEHRPVNSYTACPDDGNACTSDMCYSGVCSHYEVANFDPCPDDGNSCTEDICWWGKCTHSDLPDDKPCPGDGNNCTMDLCKEGTCEHPQKPDATSCDTNRFCRAGECSEPLSYGVNNSSYDECYVTVVSSSSKYTTMYYCYCVTSSPPPKPNSMEAGSTRSCPGGCAELDRTVVCW